MLGDSIPAGGARIGWRLWGAKSLSQPGEGEIDQQEGWLIDVMELCMDAWMHASSSLCNLRRCDCEGLSALLDSSLLLQGWSKDHPQNQGHFGYPNDQNLHCDHWIVGLNSSCLSTQWCEGGWVLDPSSGVGIILTASSSPNTYGRFYTFFFDF